MARALSAWAINRGGKNSIRNLRYGPRTRLVRGIYLFTILQMQFHYRMPRKMFLSKHLEGQPAIVNWSNPPEKESFIVSCYLFESVALVIDDVINRLRGMAMAVKAQEVHKSIDLYLTRKVAVLTVWTNAGATKKTVGRIQIEDEPLADNVTS